MACMRWWKRWSFDNVMLAGSMIAVLLVICLDANAAQRAPDFNGDGFADLPIGVPLENLASPFDAGAVQVIYGSGSGLRASGDQFWSQGTSGVPNSPEIGDQFGSSMARGDFDGDGFDDLAIGVPQEDIGGINNAGGVNILYGSPTGLRSAGAQFWSQNSMGILNSCQTSDRFGASLASGDFDGDGFFDLAIGVPGEAIDGMTNAGAVNVLYGSPSGLEAAGNQFWSQDSFSVSDFAEINDRFGLALAAGDFDRDGADDLAIGVPGEGLGGFVFVGAVNVMYGSQNQGLTAFADQFWSQNSFGVPDLIEFNDVFGNSLAVGDFDGDDIDDLAIGAPGEDIDGPFVDEGAVVVLYGRSTNGLGGSGAQFFSQDTSGMPGIPRSADHFGQALTAGDFDNDGFDDLAIGCPNDDFNSILNCGTVTILFGRNTGLSVSGVQFISQDSTGVQNVSETGDRFGWALLAGDFDDDGRDDLAIGAPAETVLGVNQSGAVHVLYGSSHGLSAIGDQFWNQDSPGINDLNETSDFFGRSLGAGEAFIPT